MSVVITNTQLNFSHSKVPRHSCLILLHIKACLSIPRVSLVISRWLLLLPFNEWLHLPHSLLDIMFLPRCSHLINLLNPRHKSIWRSENPADILTAARWIIPRHRQFTDAYADEGSLLRLQQQQHSPWISHVTLKLPYLVFSVPQICLLANGKLSGSVGWCSLLGVKKHELKERDINCFVKSWTESALDPGFWINCFYAMEKKCNRLKAFTIAVWLYELQSWLARLWVKHVIE